MGAVEKYEAPQPAAPDHAGHASPMQALIERVVMDPNAPMEKLEKLLEMQERIEANEARRAFDAAIAAARAEIRPVVKTAKVDYTTTKGRTHYQYETMDAIADQIDPILGRHGLMYRYSIEQTGDMVMVTCIVSHALGHRETTTLSAPRDQSGNKNWHQSVGSTVTYLQRYTIKAALGLAAAKDDDGRAGGQVSEQPGASTISAEQCDRLRKTIAWAGADEGRMLRHFGADSIEAFPAAKLETALEMLRAKGSAAKAETPDG